MDRFTFIERMVDHALWPVVVIIAVLLFRQPIMRKFPELSEFEIGPFFKGKFNEVLGRSQRALSNLQMPQPTGEVEADHDRLRKIAEISPRSAVLEAFRLVDLDLKERLRQFGHAPSSSEVRSTWAIMEAKSIGLLDQAKIDVWNDLRALSNTLFHRPQFEVRKEQALRYIDLASKLRSAIQDSTPSSSPRGDGKQSQVPDQLPQESEA